MTKSLLIWISSAAVLTLQGCAIVRSVPAGEGGEGIAYMLPRALLPVELVYDGSAFELRIASPVLVGDTDHTYVLQRRSNVFTSDNVVASVDPATGFLSAIAVSSADETVPAVIKLVSGLKAEAADAVTSEVIFRGLLDPDWDTDKVIAFNKRVSAAASAHVKRLALENTCKPDAAADPCKGINTLTRDLATYSFEVEVEGAGVAARTPADCSAGFCYRINVPRSVTLRGPGTSNSAVFGLPNRSPTFVMPLERWVFVKTTHDVKLEGGVFKSVTTDRPSSVLAVASAPLDLAKAVFSAVSEVVQLRIDLSGKEKALADAKVAEIESNAALEKALLDKGGGEAESAILGLTSERDGPLLSIRVGQPSRLDATKNLVGVKNTSDKSKGPAENPHPVKDTSTGKSSAGSSGSAGAGKN